MVRQLRLAFCGAWYHVMNRGLARNPIFLNNEHRQMFVDLLIEIHNRFQVEIHAYCLMSNHYHLFIRTPLGNISRIMRHLDGVYTQRFNAKIKRDGPIFRGRYKATLVDGDIYLLRLSRYIHLNPVKANIVSFAEDYEWSSYYAYLNGGEPDWLCTSQILSYFGISQQREKYKSFTEEGVDNEINEFFSKVRGMPILGSENFVKLVANRYLEERYKINEIPEHKFLVKTDSSSLYGLIEIVADFYNVSNESIFVAGKRRGNRPRAVAIFLSYLYVKNINLSEVASIFKNISSKGISQSYKRLKGRLEYDSDLSNEIKELTRRVNVQESHKSIVET
jgi:putative transposase